MFGRKKKELLKEVPSYSDEGMLAYVLRNKPEKWGKIKISGSIKGSGFKDIHSPLEVEPLTADFAGGGEYTAKFFRPGGVDYLGQYKFEIAGLPKINGEVLADPVEEKKPAGDPLDKKVVQIEKEMKVAEAEAKQAKQRKKLMAEMEDEDAGEGEEIEVDTEKEELRERVEQLEKDKQREREERREREHREDIKRLEDKMTMLLTQQGSGGTMEAFTAMITAQQESTRAMMATQQESNKVMMAAQQESTKAMLTTMDNNRKESAERSSEVTKLLLSQSNRMADVQIAAAKESADAKTNQSEHTLELIKSTWQTALAVGAGRAPSEGPKDLPGVIGDVTGRICDVVTEFIREKGKQAITPEKLTQMIRKTGQDVASGIQRPTRKALPPAAQAANPVDPRAAMNKVLKVFLSEMKAGVEDPTWWTVAERELPGPVMAELAMAAQGGDMEKLVGVVRKYADPGMADEVVGLLAQDGNEEAEPGTEVLEEPPEAAPEEAPKEPPKEAPKKPPKEAAKKPAKAPSKKKR